MPKRDHGGGLDAAIAAYGGTRERWIDLSTGINPVPYPLPDLRAEAWTALPDQAAMDHLIKAARRFWNIPKAAAVLPVPGVSIAIAMMPQITGAQSLTIQERTYNEHAAAYVAVGAKLTPKASVAIHIHPNNPTGQFCTEGNLQLEQHDWVIIDESFCDVAPEQSHIALTERSNVMMQKSFGKFWGLAGLRLGFVIGPQAAVDHLARLIGPWAVSGPALEIGAKALEDEAWAQTTRSRLAQDAQRLDDLILSKPTELLGGTDLFRLYKVPDAKAWQSHLARAHIWSRVFPYDPTWLRLGLPAPQDWPRLAKAVEIM
ncbi:MAG: threonine-phosphate decarboxylase [Pseudomonadota bacterium]